MKRINHDTRSGVEWDSNWGQGTLFQALACTFHLRLRLYNYTKCSLSLSIFLPHCSLLLFTFPLSYGSLLKFNIFLLPIWPLPQKQYTYIFFSFLTFHFFDIFPDLDFRSLWGIIHVRLQLSPQNDFTSYSSFCATFTSIEFSIHQSKAILWLPQEHPFTQNSHTGS